MFTRCYNKNQKCYKDYGGRGITVCDRWNPKRGGSFENFLEDMGEPPSKKYTLERIDNDKGYEPSNCMWSTRKQQANNRRQPNKLIFPIPKTHPLWEYLNV